jgi:hypothetical protein
MRHLAAWVEHAEAERDAVGVLSLDTDMGDGTNWPGQFGQSKMLSLLGSESDPARGKP